MGSFAALSHSFHQLGSFLVFYIPSRITCFSQISLPSELGAHSWPTLPKPCFLQAAEWARRAGSLRGARPKRRHPGGSCGQRDAPPALPRLIWEWSGSIPCKLRDELCAKRRRMGQPLWKHCLPLRSQLTCWSSRRGVFLLVLVCEVAKVAGNYLLSCLKGPLNCFLTTDVPSTIIFFPQSLVSGCDNKETSNQGPVSSNKMPVWLSF